MKLDLAALQPLITARVEMGAPLRSFELTPPSHTPIRPEPVGDIPIKRREDVDRDADERIVVGGRYAIIYIQDTRDTRALLETRPEESKKYHLSHCQTIANMLSSGRFDRYVVTDRRDGQFIVHSLEDDRSRGTLDARLAPCRNCLTLSGHTGHRDLFDLDEFFARTGDAPRRGPLPRTRDTDNRSSDYTSDWPAITGRAREKAGWRCSVCEVSLADHPRLLHTHHRDGVRSNNRPSNLQVLCVLCHGDQPCHGHLSIPIEDRQLIVERRRSRSGPDRRPIGDEDR